MALPPRRKNASDHREGDQSVIKHHRMLRQFDGKSGSVLPAMFGGSNFNKVREHWHVRTFGPRLREYRIYAVHEKKLIAGIPIQTQSCFIYRHEPPGF